MCKQTAGPTLAFWKRCFNILENAFHIQDVLPCVLAEWWLTVFECYPALPWLLTPGTQGERELSLLKSTFLKVSGLG